MALPRNGFAADWAKAYANPFCILAVALLLSTACDRGDKVAEQNDAVRNSAARVEIVVNAAASTRDALTAIESLYERDHAVDLIFNFGSSGDLARQLIASPRADVFLSADDVETERVDSAGLLVPGSRRDFLSNQLVVIEPGDRPSLFATPFSPQQLLKPAVRRLSLGNVASVPAGRYARMWLENTGVWSAIASRVLPAIDVRAALAAVESGAAEAGIVYRSDVGRTKKVRVVFAVPLADGPRITYSVALIAGRKHEGLAQEFIHFLLSPAASAAFEESGFITLPPA
jgi:molybdate transport system substrate-binding protein